MNKVILLFIATTFVATAIADTRHLVPVIVAKYDMRPYEKVISEYMVERVKYPEHLLPRYAPLDIKDVLGKLPSEPIYKGEIVSLHRLTDKDEYQNALKNLVPPGFTHTTLPFNLPETIDGLDLEKERVDIVATYKDKNGTVASIAAQRAIVGKVGPVANKRHRALFMIISEEEGHRIGLLRTMPSVSWHLLIRDRWISNDEKPLVIRQPNK